MNKIFIDTNIVVYANDRRDKQKQQKSIEIIKQLLKGGNGVISTQVIQEYAFTAINKLKQSPGAVLRQLKLLEAFEIVNQTSDQIKRAVEIMHLYQINFWDACIISNAEQGDCYIIFSEDFNTGQMYSGIQVINPLL